MGTGMDTLEAVRAAGYCTDEWETWQQGSCGTYALALIQMQPGLRLGALSITLDDGWVPSHFFAHDDGYAYDSAGRHALPYLGIHDQADECLLDIGDSEDWGIPDDEAGPEGSDYWLGRAKAHAARNDTLGAKP